jgi:hypothetical protein
VPNLAPCHNSHNGDRHIVMCPIVLYVLHLLLFITAVHGPLDLLSWCLGQLFNDADTNAGADGNTRYHLLGVLATDGAGTTNSTTNTIAAVHVVCGWSRLAMNLRTAWAERGGKKRKKETEKKKKGGGTGQKTTKSSYFTSREPTLIDMRMAGKYSACCLLSRIIIFFSF